MMILLEKMILGVSYKKGIVILLWLIILIGKQKQIIYMMAQIMNCCH